MKRSSPKRPPPDAILCADVHLRETVPECRTDDFLAAQFRKLDFIKQLQADYMPVLCAGDLFDHWKPSPWLLAQVIPRIHGWVVVPGQHDLPQHNLELLDKSGLAVLEEAGRIKVLKTPKLDFAPGCGPHSLGLVGFPWGTEPNPIPLPGKLNVAMIHRLVYPGRPPFPGAEKSGGSAKDLLKKMPKFDLVVSGDNHETFTWPAGTGMGKHLEAHPLLVNPGSVMRTTAAQVDHEPCVFLWWAETNTVERVVLPHEKGVVSREHLEQTQARDNRIAAFVERLRDDVEFGLDFRVNLREYLEVNKVSKHIADLVWEVLDGD